MTDCPQTWRAAARDPETMARVQRDLISAWANAMHKPEKAPHEPFRATGEALQRVRCPVAHRVIEKTEQNWSGK